MRAREAGARAGVPGYRSRRGLVLLVFAVLAGGLVWRAVDLQLNHKEFLQRQGDARHLRVVGIPAHRGMILDRNGAPLAVSTPVDSIWVDPSVLADAGPRVGELARMLGGPDEAARRHARRLLRAPDPAVDSKR